MNTLASLWCAQDACRGGRSINLGHEQRPVREVNDVTVRAAKLWGKRERSTGSPAQVSSVVQWSWLRRFCGASTTAEDPMDHTDLRASKYGALPPAKPLQRVQRLLGTGYGGVRKTYHLSYDKVRSNFPCLQLSLGEGS
jgi:hypothetical protein